MAPSSKSPSGVHQRPSLWWLQLCCSFLTPYSLRKIGKFPVYDLRYDGLLNKGIVKNPLITNFDKFIESAKKFFVDIEKSEHIGSMFTIRTVLPYREHDDARPTLVEKINHRMVTVFSGKIPTCINSANEVLQIVNTMMD